MTTIDRNSFANLVWGDSAVVRLAEINAWFEAHAASPLVERARADLVQRLEYLDAYGGVVHDGRWQPVPKVDPKYDGPLWPTIGWKEGWARVKVRTVREHNRTPQDLRRRFQVTLTSDLTPLSFGVTWAHIQVPKHPPRRLHRLRRERWVRENTYYNPWMVGGLVCHCAGGDGELRAWSDMAWGVHT